VICPACEHTMTGFEVQDITVDVCEGGCGGIWFDGHELKKVDEPHEAIGQELLEAKYDPEVIVDESQRRDCPHCVSIVMMRHFSSIKREVEVDECPSCGGFFLDRGELNSLREQYDTEEERSEAAKEMFGEMFDEDLDDEQDASWQRVEASRRLARMFRFLLPSFYLPGKQKWGAF
jgi:uncharacterized protein